MRVDLLTKEYPPEIYGGVGVHVTELGAADTPEILAQVEAQVSTLTRALADPVRAAEMGRAARQRAIDCFGWARIAEQTRAVYELVRTP